MTTRGMRCSVCRRWVTGMGETTEVMPNHASKNQLGVSCPGVGNPPTATRGFTNPPPTR